jgi:hypothetical protein
MKLDPIHAATKNTAPTTSYGDDHRDGLRSGGSGAELHEPVLSREPFERSVRRNTMQFMHHAAELGFDPLEINQAVDRVNGVLQSRGLRPGTATSSQIAAVFAAESERLEAIAKAREAAGGILGDVHTQHDG